MTYAINYVSGYAPGGFHGAHSPKVGGPQARNPEPPAEMEESGCIGAHVYMSVRGVMDVVYQTPCMAVNQDNVTLPTRASAIRISLNLDGWPVPFMWGAS